VTGRQSDSPLEKPFLAGGTPGLRWLRCLCWLGINSVPAAYRPTIRPTHRGCFRKAN